MANAPWYIGDKFGGFGEPAAPEMAPRPGMFGGGRNWGRTIADFLTNFSAGMGNPAAMAALQNQFQQQREAGEVKTRELARQRALEDQFGLFQRQHEYTAAHPQPAEPTQIERLMALAHIDPNSEQGRALALQAAQNAANPMTAIDVQQPDGSVVRQWVRPGSSAAPSTGPVVTDPTGWVPAGGAASGSRPFR